MSYKDKYCNTILSEDPQKLAFLLGREADEYFGTPEIDNEDAISYYPDSMGMVNRRNQNQWTPYLKDDAWTTQTKTIPTLKGIAATAEPLSYIGELTSLFHSHDRLSSSRISDTMTEIEFKLLSEKWKQESQYISLMKKMFELDSYQQIIKMGEKVIPYLLKDLRETKNYWFVALKAITKQDPIEKSHYNDFSKMTEDWLMWGRKNLFI